MRRKILVVIFILVLLPIVFLFMWPVPFEPVSWNPPDAPELAGSLTPNRALAGVNRLLKDFGKGPEDIAFDEKGNLYTGFEGGQIVTLPENGSSARVFANTNGRPSGMVFDKHGNLIVADAMKGLLSVARNGEAKVLATRAGGIPIHFADDLDIGPNGSIYLSDASIYQDMVLDIVEHGGKGRLIRYNPSSKKAEVLLKGLQFANGVTVARDGSFVLVAETLAYRIRRFWLKGPRSGEVEIFANNLPGFPDNINLTARGTVLVALPSPRSKLLDDTASKPFTRKLLFRVAIASKIFPFLETPQERYGFVIELDGNGRIIRSFHDPDGKVAFVTSATERNGKLYLGSHIEPSIAVVSLNK